MLIINAEITESQWESGSMLIIGKVNHASMLGLYKSMLLLLHYGATKLSYPSFSVNQCSPYQVLHIFPK